MRDAIDASRALIEILERRIPADVPPLKDALSRLQMAYAKEVQRVPAAGAAPEQGGGAEPDAGGEPGADREPGSGGDSGSGGEPGGGGGPGAGGAPGRAVLGAGPVAAARTGGVQRPPLGARQISVQAGSGAAR